MARRLEHGKLRAQPPRRKDLPAYTAPEPNRNHDASGRFLPGNGAAANKALKAIIKRHLGSDASGELVEALYRDTRRLYEQLLKDLPASDAPEVQDLVARRARWAVLGARYAAKAAELGLFGDDAAAALEMALKCDARAERLAVSARDEAERIARSRPEADAETPWLEAEEPAEPTKEGP